MKKSTHYLSIISLSYMICTAVHAASSPINSLTEVEIKNVRTLVNEMKANERGPYHRLRWFCKDGVVLPPQAYACKEHGGGHQHAEYSTKRQELADYGLHVGTIFTALSWDQLWDANNDNYRLKEIALEKFMIDIDNGWVLQKARSYRGRIQLEDEIEAGRELLLILLSKNSWVKDNYLLTRELVRTIPHHQGKDLTRSIRRRSTELAEAAPDFESIRVEIHTHPSERTASRVAEWVNQQNNESLSSQAKLLLSELEELYNPSGRIARIEIIKKQLNKNESLKSLLTLIKDEPDTLLKKIERYSQLLLQSRIHIESLEKADLKLLLFSLQVEIEATVTPLIIEALAGSDLSRKTYLEIMSDLLDMTFGVGLLRIEEYRALKKNTDELIRSDIVSIETYQETTRYLSYLSSWSYDNVKYVFSGPLQRYTSLDGRAALFVDDLLRSSPVFHASEILQVLSNDVTNNAGIVRRFFGKTESGLVGLNPGLAVGQLRVLTDADIESGKSISRDDIVVVPQTVAELKPVAGILTRGEGNLLSHVQLLARNFGIPNVAISHELIDRLQQYSGQKVMLLVGTDGTVFLEKYDELPNMFVNKHLAKSNADDTNKLQVPTPNLDLKRPLILSELNRSLSGKVVGPKAANLGELKRLFPDKVAPAIAIPFGIFYQHINSGQDSIRKRLVEVYNLQRTSQLTEEVLNNRLADLRLEIKNLSLDENLKQELRTLMLKHFGADGSYGIFIRSDTNVEDLPGFTGAGLSETLANIVGFKNQVDSIPMVWSSVLSERALLWRSRLLEQPEEVYASVLLMKSVNSEKSGVMITRDLWSQETGLTVATAWGVGGAVGGESAETIVLKPDGSERLLSLAKSAYKRVIDPAGGVSWKIADAGSVLTASEKAQLIKLADDVDARYGAVYDENKNKMPWDIEYGFVGGELTLFQIRPLVEKGQLKADSAVRMLVPVKSENIKEISLDEVPKR